MFGVLFRQFRILYDPCRLWHLEDIALVAKTCAILHNIIAAKQGYWRIMSFRKDMEEDDEVGLLELEMVLVPKCRYEHSEVWRIFLTLWTTRMSTRSYKRLSSTTSGKWQGKCDS